MKRRMSQGQAMRSIFGRARVTQRVGAANGCVALPSARQRSRPPARIACIQAARPQRRRTRPGSPRGRARSRRRPDARARRRWPRRRRASGRRRIAPGITCESCRNAGCRRTSTSVGGGNAASRCFEFKWSDGRIHGFIRLLLRGRQRSRAWMARKLTCGQRCGGASAKALVQYATSDQSLQQLHVDEIAGRAAHRCRRAAR